MLKVGIVIGSTRPGRKGEVVAQWVHEIAKKKGGAEYMVVDLHKFNLPMLDEPAPAAMGQYSKPHTKAWSDAVARLDAFVFVTPEYNGGTTPALTNAINFLFKEWNNKAVGFVGYGADGGTRAICQLRGMMAAVKLADVRGSVGLSLFTDFENMATFKPAPNREPAAQTMLDDLLAWGKAMKTIRE